MSITLEIIEGPNYTCDDSGWEYHAYVVTLHRDGKRLTTPWMQGLGITDDPDAADVLESLMLDASGYTNARDFEDWVESYGYDTDSRKAHALYERIGKIARELERFLGPDWDDTTTEDAHDAARRLVNA